MLEDCDPHVGLRSRSVWPRLSTSGLDSDPMSEGRGVAFTHWICCDLHRWHWPAWSYADIGGMGPTCVMGRLAFWCLKFCASVPEDRRIGAWGDPLLILPSPLARRVPV